MKTTSPPGPATIGAQVEAARGERTHAEIAAAAGLARQRVTEAAGERNVTLATLQRLATALGVPLVVHPGLDPAPRARVKPRPQR